MMVMSRAGLTKRPESGGDTEGGIWSPRSPKVATPEVPSGVKSPRAEGIKSPRKGPNDASGSSLAYRPPSEESELAKQRRAAISMPKAAGAREFILDRQRQLCQLADLRLGVVRSGVLEFL